MGTVVDFRRDLSKDVSQAISLHPGMTGEELLDRHRKLAQIWGELLERSDCSSAEIDLFERTRVYSDKFHILAEQAGVAERAVRAFNAGRADWKAWAAYRASIPLSRRL